MEVPQLKIGVVYQVGVFHITLKHDSFKKTGTNTTMWCHFFIAHNLADNIPYNFQICTEKETVEEFEVQDVISIKIKQFNTNKQDYTIQFVSLDEKGGVLERKKQQVQRAEEKAGPQPALGSVNLGNPVVSGTAADRALYAAAHMHHMRNTTIAQVMADAEAMYSFLMTKQKG